MGIISRNQPRKCHPALFEAFAKWTSGHHPKGRNRENSWIYVHAGIKDCGWNLEDMAHRFGIADRVIYNEEIEIGAGIPDSDMWMVYNSCDFTTLPAKGEGWGLSISESMACEVPVSASPYSGHGSPGGGWAVGAFEPIEIKTYDCEPITGIMRALVDIDDYADSMSRITEPKRYAQLKTKGYNLVKTLHWNVVLPQWEKFIDSLTTTNTPYPTREEQLQRKQQETLQIPCAYPPDALPKVSVIMPVSMMVVPNYHQMILQSIRSIENQNYRNLELILVDNLAFGAHMTQVMMQMPHKVLRWPHKYHASKVLNLAAQHATGDFLYFTHSDIALEPNALLHMINATVLKINVGVVSSILVHEESKTACCGYGKNEIDEIVELHEMQSGTQVVDGVHDGSILIKKEYFDMVEGFDEDYKMVNHSVDLCLKLKEKDLLSYVCEAAKGLHYRGLSHLYKPMSILMWDRNQFMKKHIVDNEAKISEDHLKRYRLGE
jgi:hypothetical protein